MALIKFDVTNRFSGEVPPNCDRVRELFEYDQNTGLFRYRTRAARRCRPGDIAGSVNNQGYRHIRVDGRSYKAHRIAWLYVCGVWPTEMVDHINGSRDDNRIENLRLATRSDNLGNSTPFRAGKLPHKGVRQMPNGRWSARIQRNKVPNFIGYFATEREAVAAYQEAAQKTFGDFSRVSK